MQHPDKTFATYVLKHMQHSDKHTCNIRLKKQTKHGHILTTYVYNHRNICNIPIYFCNIRMKTCNVPLKHLTHLKCTLETCIVSRCCLLGYLHRGATAVTGGEVGGARAAWGDHRK
jgi:hypothetical protein